MCLRTHKRECVGMSQWKTYEWIFGVCAMMKRWNLPWQRIDALILLFTHIQHLMRTFCDSQLNVIDRLMMAGNFLKNRERQNMPNMCINFFSSNLIWNEVHPTHKYKIFCPRPELIIFSFLLYLPSKFLSSWEP